MINFITTLLLCLLCLMTHLSDGQFSKGIRNMVNQFQNTLGDIQSFIGEPDGCRYTCPYGTKPNANPNHKPSSNGCGSYGFQIQLDEYIPNDKLTTCCNEHDLCYDICNKHKEACDNRFKNCLEKLCDGLKKHVSKNVYESCKSMADMLYAGTLALGCKSYKESQKNACLCEPSRKTYTELSWPHCKRDIPIIAYLASP